MSTGGRGSRRRNAVADMWRTRRLKRRGGPVGTEADALANTEKNRRNFGYPGEFETRIEHSLLYNMIKEPGIYPDDVIRDHIAEEDFTAYLSVAPSSNRGSRDDGEGEASYAQLSAIMALSAENYPPKKNGTDGQEKSIPQVLCKAVLRFVTRYAEEHGLDRQAEMQELLNPVERHALKRNNKAAINSILPLYIGYAASIVIANPLPLLAGASAMSVMSEKMERENENVIAISSQTNRKADIEKASLLDETDDF